MILIVENGIDFATYMNVHVLWQRHHTPAYLEKHGTAAAQRICWVGWDESPLATDLSDMAAGETLYIAAHGDRGTVGLYKPKRLAEYLLSHGLTDSITHIKLLACRSALASNPFNKLLATELYTQSKRRIDISVTGFPGDMTRDLAGKFRTMADGTPEYDALMTEEQGSFGPGLEEAQRNFIYAVVNYDPADQHDLIRKAKEVTDQFTALGREHSTYCPECRRSLEQSIDNLLLDNKVTSTRAGTV